MRSPGPAYTASGYKATGNAAEVACARLFRIDQFRARYEELMAPAVKAAQVSVERVLQELQRLAFYDMTALLDTKDGKITLRDPTKLPEDLGRPYHGGRREGWCP